MTAYAKVDLYPCPTLQARIMPVQCDRNRERYRAAQKVKGFDSEKIATVPMKGCLECPGVIEISKGESVTVSPVKAETPAEDLAPKSQVRARARARYSVLGGTPTPKEEPMAKPKTCTNGHPLEGEGLTNTTDGRGRCRACSREYTRRNYQKRKAREAPGTASEPAAAPVEHAPEGYDAIIEKLRLRRGELIGEAAKIDAAIETLEGLRS